MFKQDNIKQNNMDTFYENNTFIDRYTICIAVAIQKLINVFHNNNNQDSHISQKILMGFGSWFLLLLLAGNVCVDDILNLSEFLLHITFVPEKRICTFYPFNNKSFYLKWKRPRLSCGVLFREKYYLFFIIWHQKREPNNLWIMKITA